MNELSAACIDCKLLAAQLHYSEYSAYGRCSTYMGFFTLAKHQWRVE
jgi:hypothetical protein